MTLPAPSATYDPRNEAQFRAQVDRLLGGPATSATALVASPTFTSGNNNDYALGAFVELLRVTTDASGSTLTGIANGAPMGSRARTLLLVNIGSAALTIAHQSASSVAANRITTPGSVSWTVRANDVAWFVYDDLTVSWRLVQTRDNSHAPGEGARVIFDHYTDANNATTVETDLYSDTLAAARLANNGEKIEARYGGVYVGDATSTQELRVYFGGTLVFDSGALAIGVTALDWDMSVSVVRVSSSVVRVSVTLESDFSALPGDSKYTEITGLTLANAQILKITGQAAGVTAASSQITAKLGHVLWLPAAG